MELKQQNLQKFTKVQLINKFNTLRKPDLIRILENVQKGNIYIENRKTQDKKIEPIPLVPPNEINIPEIYIMLHSGACLFHLNMIGGIKSEPVNEDLMASYLSALNMFAETMGWVDGVNSVKSGKKEISFHKGKYVIVCLVSQTEDDKSRYQIIPVLEDFARDLSEMFESKYGWALKKQSTNTSSYENFNKIFEKLLTQYRNRNFELYQKLILVESQYLGLPDEKFGTLITKLSMGEDIMVEMSKMILNFPILKNAIQKINYQNYSIWQIFSTPIFQV
jgi:hypothetical protein